MVNILKRLFSGDPNLRKARFAGLFYPKDRDELQARLDQLFAEVGPVADRSARAIVVPHSELDYSGAIVAEAFARARPPKRIVLLGPSRRVPFRGVAATSSEGFDSPLGWVRVDREAYLPIAEHSCARQLEDAHDAEPSLELQVPFIKHQFDGIPIVPLVVGDSSIGDLETVIELLWGDDVLVVVASEMSHGLEVGDAREADRETARLICEGAVDALDGRQLSGRRIVQALLTIAGERGLSAETVKLGNSADVGGPDDSTVGYGAFVVL